VAFPHEQVGYGPPGELLMTAWQIQEATISIDFYSKLSDSAASAAEEGT